MKRFINRHFGYGGKELWEDGVWKDRFSALIPLAERVNLENLKRNRIDAKPEGAYRAEGDYDVQQECWIYPEKVEELKRLGLKYHTTRACIYLTPCAHLDKTGYDDDMDALFVLASADLSYQNWNMDVLGRYDGMIRQAAEKGMALMFICHSGEFCSDYIDLVQEAIVLFHYNYNRMYLDVSPLINAGISLKDIPFRYEDLKGSYVENPDECVARLGEGIYGISISEQWSNRVSLTQGLIQHTGGNAIYDPQDVILSEEGRRMVEGIALELSFDDVRDTELKRYFDEIGVDMAVHYTRGEPWYMFAPKGLEEQPGTKMPVMCIFQEVSDSDAHQPVTAFAYCYEYIRLATQGDLLALFFVLEDIESNDLLHEVLADAERLYPVDRSRVYITGHSHDGRFAAAYMRRHQRDIAALAQVGNEPGQLSPEVTSGFFQVSDEQLQIQAQVDTPVVIVSGYLERNCMFPLYKDAPGQKPGSRIALNTKEKRIFSWQRRLISSRCPMKSLEEIAATEFSEDYVERMLGIPADKTECLYLNGHENYIADIANNEGKYHLRVVALGDMPHTVTPTMADLCWSYVRRFARDQQTGETIELY